MGYSSLEEGMQEVKREWLYNLPLPLSGLGLWVPYVIPIGVLDQDYLGSTCMQRKTEGTLTEDIIDGTDFL
jgi:hypothetical protein